MSVVTIRGTTYTDVEVIFHNDSPKSITFSIPKANLDLDEVAADFRAGENVVTINGEEYLGYVMFRSLAYDLDKIVILIAQKSVEEQLAEANAEIAELQDATAAILELLG